jgi:hypothetical protein
MGRDNGSLGVPNGLMFPPNATKNQEINGNLSGKITIIYDQGWSHHPEGLFNPNPMKKEMVTDFGYPRACRFRKYQK